MTTKTERSYAMNTLEEELKFAEALNRKLAQRNYWFAFIVTLISVLASISAGILVALDTALFSPGVIAAVASLPAGMMTINTVFRFEQKSTWFWKKNKAAAALYRALVFEAADPATISQQFSAMEAEMEDSWVTFGTPSSQE